MKLTKNACSILLISAASSAIQNASATTIYSMSSSTTFGNNTSNAGTGSTFSDNMDGTFTLATAANSGANTASFVDSSDGGTIAGLLGRSLTSADIVTVSITISSSNADLNANGNEFGLQSAPGFRANPNLMLQVDNDGIRGGLAPFFSTSGSGANLNTTQTPGATQASIRDGATLTAVYDAAGITYTVSDVVLANVNTGDTTTTNSYTYSYTDSNYVSNFETLVGDSYSYFSFQKIGAGTQNTVLSDFSISVVPEPSSLSLLALAAGLMMRRQRK